MKFTLDLTSDHKDIPKNLKNFLSGLVKISVKDNERRSRNGPFEIDLFSLDELLKMLDFDDLVIRKQYDFEDDELIKSHPYHIEIYNDWRE